MDVVLVCLMLTSAWMLLFSLQCWFCPIMSLGCMLTIFLFIYSLILISTKRLCWFFGVFIVGCFHGHCSRAFIVNFVQEVFIISIWVLLTMDTGIAFKSLIMLMKKNSIEKKKKLIVLGSFHFIHKYCFCVHNINLIQECWLVF